MAHETTTHTITNTRDMRFGEILVVKPDGIQVYNTTGMNDCPAGLWDGMDLEQIKSEQGAVQVQLNGPKYWMMDSQRVAFGETVSFGGLEARWAATLDPEIVKKAAEGSKPYTIFMPKKQQYMVYDAGKQVFELVDPEGHVYVLQAHGEDQPIHTLPDLGERLKGLPEGWEYRVRTLTEDLVLDLTPDGTIYAVGDELGQYYTRI